jgi:hypothetical protein
MGLSAYKSTEIFNKIGSYGTARDAAPLSPKPQVAGAIPVSPAITNVELKGL